MLRNGVRSYDRTLINRKDSSLQIKLPPPSVVEGGAELGGGGGDFTLQRVKGKLETSASYLEKQQQ